ncbi:MAG: AraC family transcriptional regulator [Conexibacter sp.]|nr:AraC family transcriptional regulator [Conexibacter sp.]
MIAHHVSPAGDWESVTRPPHPALAPLVHRGYVGYVEHGGPLRRLETPHEAITVIVNLGPPIAVLGWGAQRSFVAGLHDRAVVTEHAGEQCGIQLDLTPLGARMLFGLPMRELARRVVDLGALVPDAVVERMGQTADWAARFAALDAFLLARLDRAVAPRPDVAFAWGRLRETHGAVGVAQLCAELGCSRRHLSARFGDEVGLGPKAVGRILRFRRVLELLARADGAARLGEIAAAGGYCDQPHLNRDFRELAGCTPGEYLARVLPGGRGVAG